MSNDPSTQAHALAVLLVQKVAADSQATLSNSELDPGWGFDSGTRPSRVRLIPSWCRSNPATDLKLQGFARRSDLATFREAGNVFASAKGQRGNRLGRLTA